VYMCECTYVSVCGEIEIACVCVRACVRVCMCVCVNSSSELNELAFFNMTKKPGTCNFQIYFSRTNTKYQNNKIT
jgi:hypothetical protein